MAYIVTAASLDTVYKRLAGFRNGTGTGLAEYVFNGATFSASVIIGMAVYDEQVLRLVGDTTCYLILAGVAGLLYSLHALKPTPGRRV